MSIGRRLVLFEGLPGTGKSTTAQFLALNAARHGLRARWHYEEEAEHPVTGSYHPAAEPLARWAAFVTRAREDDELVVLESAWLQWPVMALLRHGVPAQDILAVLGDIATLLAPLDPLLVYLTHPDVETAVRAIGARRGAGWVIRHIATNDGSAFSRRRGISGFDALVQYWREHAALCDRAVAAWPHRQLVLDVSRGDWTARRRDICRVLELEADDDERPVPAPSHYAGKYRGLVGGKEREVVVAAGDGALVIQGLLWPDNRLLADRGIFHAEGWPLTVRFTEDARVVTIEGRPFRWGTLTGTLARVV